MFFWDFFGIVMEDLWDLWGMFVIMKRNLRDLYTFMAQLTVINGIIIPTIEVFSLNKPITIAKGHNYS